MQSQNSGEKYHSINVKSITGMFNEILSLFKAYFFMTKFSSVEELHIDAKKNRFELVINVILKI